MDYVLLAGSSNPEFAKGVSRHLGIPLLRRKARPFSCGEPCVEIQENVRGKEVVIMQSVGRNIDGRSTNYYLIELLLLVNACALSNAKSITVVVPCYPFARQDKKDRPRVPISAKVVADMFQMVGTTRLVTMDLHAAQIQGFFNIPVDNLYAINVIIDRIGPLLSKETHVLVSPDNGGSKRIEAYASKLKLNSVIMHKSRDYTQESVVSKSILVGDGEGLRGKTAVIVDDMIDTGGTIVKCCEALEEFGVRSVILVVTHGILSGPAIPNLQNCPMIEAVFITNTLPPPTDPSFTKLQVIDVAPLIGDVIHCIFSGDSVAKFFE